MSDYFDRVEQHLLDAVERHAARRARPAGALRERIGELRGRLPGRRRSGLIALVVVLVLSGSAAGAALLSEQRSRPLSGVVPPYVPNGDTISTAGSHYAITLTPSLQAGSVGWCNFIFYRDVRGMRTSNRGFDYGSGTCGGETPAVGSPLFAEGGERGGLWYVLTGPHVAAVRVTGGPTVLTRSEARLPYGYRAAVFQLKDRRFTPSHPPQLTALNASGQVIPGATYGEGEGPPQEQTRSWSEPDERVQGACSIAAIPGSGVREQQGVVVSRLVADPGIVGHAFLSCEQVRLSVPGTSEVAGTSETAALLVDAKHPGDLPVGLPDARAVKGAPGIYTNSGDSQSRQLDFVARREGDAWLLVSGGPKTSEAETIRTLRALRAGPIARPTTTGAPRVPADAECRISARPRAGLLEVSQTTFLVHGHRVRAPKIGGPMPELSSCASAHFYLHDWPISATVLYPRASSGAPAQLAKREPLRGHRQVFTNDYFEGFERHDLLERVGRVWLEIEGGRDTGQRLALLRALRVHVARARDVQLTIQRPRLPMLGG